MSEEERPKLTGRTYERKRPPLDEVLADLRKDPRFAAAVQKRKYAERGQKRAKEGIP